MLVQVSAVRFAGAGGINYLLIVLAEGTTREQLEAIKPDTSAMLAASNQGAINGVIVCCHGGERLGTLESGPDEPGNTLVCCMCDSKCLHNVCRAFVYELVVPPALVSDMLWSARL